ncbi:secreted antigen 1 [Babesia caballi]|uniref:Secreted antigen 1 n=1 Tax=Babesia caballi TaxID=5871 RepID=A0AAV4LLI9_BABCB|nr:secreted antigen 1 [Babesia caballi]
MADGCHNIKPPETLREALAFLSKLHTLSAAGELGTKLESKVKEALGDFAGESVNAALSHANDITSNLKAVLEKAKALRDVIIISSHRDTYGDYDKLQINKCIENCVDILLKSLPIIYNTLYYLTFQVSDSVRKREGGEWKYQQCKTDLDYNAYLYKWLIGNTGIPSYDGSNIKLLPCSFRNEELSDKYGSDLHEALLYFVDGEGEETCFSSLLVAILFTTNLAVASTATALTVVAAFCRAVHKETFGNKPSESTYLGLDTICVKVLENLKYLAPWYGESTSANLVACEGALYCFFEKLKPDDFPFLIGWLKKNLKTIIYELRQMDAASKKWSTGIFDQGKHAGPFVYGFLFGEVWASGSYTAQSKLHSVITQLTDQANGSLTSLLKCINPEAETIVNNEQPQQETPAAEAVGAAANHAATSKHVSGSVAVSGMAALGVMPGGGFVTSDEHVTGNMPQEQHTLSPSSAEEPRGFSSTVGSNASEGVQNSTDHPSTGDQGGGKTQGHGAPYSIREPGYDHTSALMTETHRGEVASRTNQNNNNSASSGAPNESDNIGTVTAGDNSTVTIGSAAGGVALLGGGGAALYFLNVGGIKTLITGVP